MNMNLRAHNTSHNINITTDEEVCIKGTYEQFSILVKNLIDNAIKYSESTDTIDVELFEKTDVVILSVKDKGIGIPDEEKDKIFQRFYRSEKSEELGIEGNGLGLSIVRSIVEEFSGKIEILNNKPTGTIFTIKLPKSYS